METRYITTRQVVDRTNARKSDAAPDTPRPARGEIDDLRRTRTDLFRKFRRMNHSPEASWLLADQEMERKGLRNPQTLEDVDTATRDMSEYQRAGAAGAAAMMGTASWMIDQLPGESKSKYVREGFKLMGERATANATSAYVPIMGAVGTLADPVALAAYSTGLGGLEKLRTAGKLGSGLLSRVAQEGALTAAIETPLAYARGDENPLETAAFAGGIGAAMPIIGKVARPLLGMKPYAPEVDRAVESARGVIMDPRRKNLDERLFNQYDDAYRATVRGEADALLDQQGRYNAQQWLEKSADDLAVRGEADALLEQQKRYNAQQWIADDLSVQGEVDALNNQRILYSELQARQADARMADFAENRADEIFGRGTRQQQPVRPGDERAQNILDEAAAEVQADRVFAERPGVRPGDQRADEVIAQADIFAAGKRDKQLLDAADQSELAALSDEGAAMRERQVAEGNRRFQRKYGDKWPPNKPATAVEQAAPTQRAVESRPLYEDDIAEYTRKQAIQEALGDPLVDEEIKFWVQAGKTQDEAERIALTGVVDDAPSPREAGASGGQLDFGFRSGFAPQDFEYAIQDALTAGKWVVHHTTAAAKWAIATAGDAIRSMRDFANVLMQKFGRAIRKHIPAAWQKFKQVQQRRYQIRQQTQLLRQKGGIDWRNGMSETKANRIEQSVRAEVKREVSRRDAAIQENKNIIVKDVKREIPKKSGEQGNFLTNVRDAKSAADVRRAQDKIAKTKFRIENKRDAFKKSREIGKLKIGKAARNSEFNSMFDEAQAILDRAKLREGANRPDARRRIKESVLLGLEPSDRDALVDVYKRIEADYAASRIQAMEAPVVAKQSREIADGIKALGRSETKVVPGSGGNRTSSLPKKILRNDFLQPERLIARLGESARKYIFDPINEAATRQVATYKRWRNEFDRNLKAIGIDRDSKEGRRWLNGVSGTSAKTRTISLSKGDLTMTDGQFYGLLATLNRAEGLQKVLGGAEVSIGNNTIDRVAMSVDDIEKIVGMATEQDWKIVKAGIGVMNTDDYIGAVNGTWRKLKGTDLIRKEGGDYYPIVSDAEKTVDDLEGIMIPDLEGKIENRGFTKEITESTHPIIINDFFGTIDRHLQQVSAVVEMSSDMRRVRGILGSRAFKDNVVRYYGDDVVKSLDKYVRDVAEETALFSKPIDPVNVGLSRLVSNVGVGVLGLNPWVVLKQIPSFFNAMIEISPSYLLRGAREALNPLSAGGKAIRARMREHSPMIWARYEMHAARLVGDMSTAPDLVKRSKGLLEKTMLGISWADENVIASIWRASELKISETMPKLSGDAYWKAVAGEADRVIRRTQPNFHAVNTSAVQRGGKKNPFMKAASMFMSQRNTNYSLLYDAVASGDKKKMAAVLAVVAGIQPLLISAVDETRDTVYGRQENDDFGDLAISLATDAVANNLSQVYFAGTFLDPLSRKVSNSLTGKKAHVFDPSNPISSVAMNMSNGLSKMLSGAMDGSAEDAWKGLERVLLSGSSMMGVPLQTPYRAVENILEQYQAAGDNEEE